MADCISRSAAIKAARRHEVELPLYAPKETDIFWNDAIDIICDELESLPSAEPEPKWVPVSEGLPEDYQDVLVWFEYFRYGDYNCMYSTYGIGNYSNQYDSWLINHETGWTDLHVFAWMPLPEPYKEGEQDE